MAVIARVDPKITLKLKNPSGENFTEELGYLNSSVVIGDTEGVPKNLLEDVNSLMNGAVSLTNNTVISKLVVYSMEVANE